MSSCIDVLESTNAILEFPRSMEHYFSRYGIVSLDLAEPRSESSVGIYLLRERYEDPLLNDMLGLMRHYLDENRQQLT